MKWFSNLKIKNKLVFSFILLSIFTVIVGAIGIISLNTIKRNNEKMYDEAFKPALELKEVEKNLLEARSNILLIANSSDMASIQKRISDIDFIHLDNNNKLKKFEENLTADDVEKFEVVKTALQSYRTLRTEYIRLVQIGRIEEADSKLTELLAADDKVSDALSEFINHKMEYVDETNAINSKASKGQLILVIIFVAIGLLSGIGLGIIIANLISRPLKNLLSSANEIENGNLDVDIEVNSRDEVGELGLAFKEMAETLQDLMVRVGEASEQVAEGARQVSNTSMALSQGATEQASSIEELTASLEEILAQTKLNAENADKANNLVEDVKASAESGNQQVKEMLAAMDEINESSSNIYKIVKAIDEIAFLTNILALNAAVEAARAGQHGRGFAVVAEEVRNLAVRSAEAAKETTEMIEASMKKIEAGTKIARQTAGAFSKISLGVTNVAGLVNDIAVASNEQATGISQINQGILQVSNVVQTNSATSEESASASEILSGQADRLKELLSKFTIRLDEEDEDEEDIDDKSIEEVEYEEDEENDEVIEEKYKKKDKEKVIEKVKVKDKVKDKEKNKKDKEKKSKEKKVGLISKLFKKKDKTNKPEKASKEKVDKKAVKDTIENKNKKVNVKKETKKTESTKVISENKSVKEEKAEIVLSDSEFGKY